MWVILVSRLLGFLGFGTVVYGLMTGLAPWLIAVSATVGVVEMAMSFYLSHRLRLTTD